MNPLEANKGRMVYLKFTFCEFQQYPCRVGIAHR